MLSFGFQDLSPIRSLKRRELRKEINELIANENYKAGNLAVVFCSDAYLLNINKEYLDHDYYTDIITFDYTDGKLISGDLIVSYDRVRDNAQTIGSSVEQELKRVVYHGVLHLCGYKDKSKADKIKMTERENFYLHHFKV